jgi:hypothetical protein
MREKLEPALLTVAGFVGIMAVMVQCSPPKRTSTGIYDLAPWNYANATVMWDPYNPSACQPVWNPNNPSCECTGSSPRLTAVPPATKPLVVPTVDRRPYQPMPFCWSCHGARRWLYGNYSSEMVFGDGGRILAGR